jgi:hypothetical protein
MDYAGERYAGSSTAGLHTHSVALSQFLDVQCNLKATWRWMPMSSSWPGRSGRRCWACR